MDRSSLRRFPSRLVSRVFLASNIRRRFVKVDCSCRLYLPLFSLLHRFQFNPSRQIGDSSTASFLFKCFNSYWSRRWKVLKSFLNLGFDHTQHQIWSRRITIAVISNKRNCWVVSKSFPSIICSFREKPEDRWTLKLDKINHKSITPDPENCSLVDWEDLRWICSYLLCERAVDWLQSAPHTH